MKHQMSMHLILITLLNVVSNLNCNSHIHELWLKSNFRGHYKDVASQFNRAILSNVRQISIYGSTVNIGPLKDSIYINVRWMFNLHKFKRLIEQKFDFMIQTVEYITLKQLQLIKIILKRNCIQGIIKKVWSQLTLKIIQLKRLKQLICQAVHIMIQLQQKSKLSLYSKAYLENLEGLIFIYQIFEQLTIFILLTPIYFFIFIIKPQQYRQLLFLIILLRKI
ncbi:unnamed protein product [Paramecium pentaurelia]|uniref:Transmembrane protein n=1 Tax=Paramecium pentaurelia TaxID=43138 RepID=A0A8S1VQB6_9CILI|nr:unnamed protein product [Paramecium pentaurelia]